MNPLFLTDGYKVGHHQQYPKGTELVYSNFTPRSNKYAPKGFDHVVCFGPQLVMRKIDELFKNDFFNKPKDEVCGEMKREMSMYLDTDYDVTHFEELHDLGYLPIHVKALKEGTLAPIKVPMFTIYNTEKRFFWVTNYLETIISNMLWKPMTSATIAYNYRKVLNKWMRKTSPERDWFVDWQGHDFSMRGLDSVDSVITSGLGHLTSFTGTDSLPTIYGARKFYDEDGFVCGSVPASEHSVMCSGSKDDEVETFRRLIRTYPKGILSVVSDTWDLWKVLTEYLPILKDEILSRDGKLVIRPDSGDPVDIICGDPNSKHPSHKKGVISLLWDVFGGTINESGYRVLDDHIGAIYGDSITIDRANEMCRRLEEKGYASTNIVLGVGGFTYQYNTRDTFGFAMKATYVTIDGVGREIFKDPITDDGIKKSAKGLLYVEEVDGVITLEDGVSWEKEGTGLLQSIYIDGDFKNVTTLTEIREMLKND